MRYSYEIVTGTSPVTGDPTWTVVEYVDDIAQGGDHHWVREVFADRARLLYLRQPELHGEASSVLAAAFKVLGYGEMFHENTCGPCQRAEATGGTDYRRAEATS